jgi:DNA repair exonuclease SbcCD ATPase subunit
MMKHLELSLENLKQELQAQKDQLTTSCTEFQTKEAQLNQKVTVLQGLLAKSPESIPELREATSQLEVLRGELRVRDQEICDLKEMLEVQTFYYKKCSSEEKKDENKPEVQQSVKSLAKQMQLNLPFLAVANQKMGSAPLSANISSQANAAAGTGKAVTQSETPDSLTHMALDRPTMAKRRGKRT